MHVYGAMQISTSEAIKIHNMHMVLFITVGFLTVLPYCIKTTFFCYAQNCKSFTKITTSYAHSLFLLCLHYAPRLTKLCLAVILINKYSIRAFPYKVTVLLESIDA